MWKRLLTKDPLSRERYNGQAKEKKNFAEEGREEMFLMSHGKELKHLRNISK